MFAMFLAAVDQTILASALPAIVASLGGFADLSWVVVAYLLAATVAAPLYGSIGDRFGRRRTLLAALAVFTLASLGCALAPTLLTLILARAVQGLGGGGLMTLSQALISENVPPRQRAQFQGYFAGVFAASSTLGPAARRAADRAAELAGDILHQPAAGRARRSARAAHSAQRAAGAHALPPRRARHAPVRRRHAGAAVCAVLRGQSLWLAGLAPLRVARAGARPAWPRSWPGKCARPTR